MEVINQQKIILFSIKKLKSSIRVSIFLSQKIKSAFRTVEFVGDRIYYIVLVSKDSFYARLRHIRDHFLKYLMKILVKNCNAQLSRGNTFKQTIENEGLHEINNNNGVTRQNLSLKKSTC
jgi:hypothetical protein